MSAETHRFTPIKVGPTRNLSNGGRMWPTIDVELERGKEFHGVPQWKVSKTPAWSRGQGGRGGGGGGGLSVEERAEVMRMAALQAASRLAAAGLLAATEDESIEAATVRAASWLLAWLRDELRVEVAAPSEPASGDPAPDDDSHAHSWAGVEGKPWRRCISCGVTQRAEVVA
jgi:hypothetical protein